MQYKKIERQKLGEQEAARRDFLGRIGKASLGVPATVMLMNVTEKQASATGNTISGGGNPDWEWSETD